jgi:NAD(P)-dependent dehydrogenase (short-subunit alcohol dehydrogenase family)
MPPSAVDKMALSGRVAIVTGGGTGIGKATAKALAESRARVAKASRNPSHLEVAKGELEGLGQAINVCGGQTMV